MNGLRHRWLHFRQSLWVQLRGGYWRCLMPGCTEVYDGTSSLTH